MTIRADASDEEVNASGFLNHFLVVGALFHQVGSVAVENVDVLLRAVNVVEEIAGHECVIALRVCLRQTDVFIHVEGDDVFERYLSCTAGLDEGVVHTHGRRTCRQT